MVLILIYKKENVVYMVPIKKRGLKVYFIVIKSNKLIQLTSRDTPRLLLKTA